MTSAIPLSGLAGKRPEPSPCAMEQAAEWYALLRSGEASDGDYVRWRAWLEGDPDHRQAWSYVEAVSKNFVPIQHMADPRRVAEGVWTANSRTRQRRKALACIAALGGTALLGWSAWRHMPLPGAVSRYLADYRSAVGDRREVVLPDGTHVWLNTATAFNKDYRADLRRLFLLEGEILIQTAADAQRPFVVETPQGQLLALGTRFTVRREGDEVFLAVFEGAVRVRTAAGAASTIAAGWQTRFTGHAVQASQPADAAREAWSRGMLVARDLPLSEFVAELRRYRTGHLDVAPEVAHLRVFGNFPLQDTDETLALLASLLPVRIQRRGRQWVRIEPRP